jgi:poly(3-hydroxybutyrate) depolymerase
MHTLTSDNTQRSYWVEMPATYDRYKAYPVIIGLHWRDGSAADVYGWSGFFGLKNLYGDNAIFIAPQGLDKGWANTGDRDIRFLRAMIGEVQQGACTDPQRVFATGFSFGGMMSNAIGCQMGDVVRAIAPMAGSLWSGCASSSNKVAALFIHAKDDNVVPYTAGWKHATFSSNAIAVVPPQCPWVATAAWNTKAATAASPWFGAGLRPAAIGTPIFRRRNPRPSSIGSGS